MSIFTVPQGKFLYCTFHMKKYTKVGAHVFDAEELPYFIISAIGYAVDATGIKLHKESFSTPNKIELWSTNSVSLSLEFPRD